MAILAGDGLQAEAFALLAREPAATTRRSPGASCACSPWSRRPRARRHGRRTGHRPVRRGAHAGGGQPRLDAAGARRHARAQDRGADPRRGRRRRGDGRRPTTRRSRAVDAWAADVGLAFQIVDDILDVEGASAELGKTAGKDAAAGKPTYPALFGLARSKALAADAVARADAALAGAGLAGGHLAAIARWIVERRS